MRGGTAYKHKTLPHVNDLDGRISCQQFLLNIHQLEGYVNPPLGIFLSDTLTDSSLPLFFLICQCRLLTHLVREREENECLTYSTTTSYRGIKEIFLDPIIQKNQSIPSDLQPGLAAHGLPACCLPQFYGAVLPSWLHRPAGRHSLSSGYL